MSGGFASLLARVPASSLRRAAPFLVLAFAVAAVYLPALENGFTNWDDDAYVYENPQIFSLGLENLARMFSPNTTVTSDWTPLVTLSHALEYSLFGLDPAPYHATNILLHMGTTAVVFALLARAGVPLAIAFVGALVFGIHPLQVESVAWISGRKNLMAGLFGFAAILVYLRGGSRAYGFALLLMVLSALSKGTAVVVPPLLVATLAMVPRERPWRREALALLPFFAVALARGLLTVELQEEVWARTASSPLVARISVMGGVLASYVRQLFWPADLRLFYEWTPRVDLVLLSGWFGVLGLSALTLWRARRAPWLAYLWVCIPLALFPMLNLFPAPYFQADRYVYMALPAAGALVAALLFGLGARTRGWVAPALLGLWCGLVLVPTTLRLIPTWRDSYSLWTHTLRHEPTSYVAYNNLGLWYEKQRDYEKAMHSYAQSSALNPNFLEARLNLATVNYRLGRHAEAEVLLRELLVRAEERPRIRLMLGLVLQARGVTREAGENYRRALALDPENIEALTNLGSLLVAQGQGAAARSLYHRAIGLPSHTATGLNQRSIALRALGRLEEAERSVRQAIGLDPEDAVAHLNLGAVLIDRGRPGEAIRPLERALELDPTLYAAHNNLGNAYSALGDLDSGLLAYERALELEPDLAEALHNSANALFTLGRFEEAETRYRRALELRPDLSEAEQGLRRLHLRTGPSTPKGS